jgi:hypothetical protein
MVSDRTSIHASASVHTSVSTSASSILLQPRPVDSANHGPGPRPAIPTTVTIAFDADESHFEQGNPTSDVIVTSDELDPGSISDTDPENVLNVQEILEDAEVEDDSTTIDADQLNFQISWEALVRWPPSNFAATDRLAAGPPYGHRTPSTH